MTRTTAALDGRWEFRFDDEPDWRLTDVPGCWETPEGPKDRSGPAWYRTRITVPAGDLRHWLEFDAVSYDCRVFLDGREVGAHTGLWDSFYVELPGVAPGEHELSLLVEKPASLTAGPDSPAVPGRFPLRTTLAGFLPYVWGHIFGGIWQSARLCSSGPSRVDELRARGTAAGQVLVEVACSGPAAPLTIELSGPMGDVAASAALPPDDAAWAEEGGVRRAAVTLYVASPHPWSPQEPARYAVRARLGDGDDELAVRFGLRDLRASGTDILLNGRPLYPRMALSWGWYPDILHANPGPERVREELLHLQALGYNGVKLCLWLPPQYYFDLADELGMLLWVELPMWLPQPDEHFRRQVGVEYERMVRQSCGHPSVVLYTLGCELNRAIGPDILQPLFEMVKRHAPDALVRDNSGSGEAYGGLLNEYAEFYDYHFYSDIQFFRPLIDYFTPRWRPVQPWVFGEFCDLDTFRDPDQFAGAWWGSKDPAVNPQGARWQFDAPFQEERLRAGGLWERRAELEQISYAHGLLHRKWTLEAVRQYREIGGYVITGEVDTPISTAGMWDEAGHLKFEPREFQAFNADTVALVGWDKRRAWVDGGDRAAYWDTWSYRAGAAVRPHLVVSHYGLGRGPTRATWSVAFDGEEPFAGGAADGPAVAQGDLREVAVVEFRAPAVAAPRRATLRVAVEVAGARAENAWPLWFFPEAPWGGLEGLGLVDPRGLLRGLESLAPGLRAGIGGPAVVATEWSDALRAYVEGGGRALLVETGEGPGGPLPSAAMPFWREAVRVAEPHAAWGDFPHGGWAGLQFFGCAADRALDLAGRPEAEAVLRRVDSRTMAQHAYIAALPLGGGRLIVTTLRPQGGAGEQPAGVARGTAGAYLLVSMARSLAGGMV